MEIHCLRASGGVPCITLPYTHCCYSDMGFSKYKNRRCKNRNLRTICAQYRRVRVLILRANYFLDAVAAFAIAAVDLNSELSLYRVS